MNGSLLRLLLKVFTVVLIQTVFLSHLTIYGSSADLVFVFSVSLCLELDRTRALLFTALAAFFQDAMLDLWGLHLISKTLFVYFFYSLLTRFRDTVFSPPQVFFLLIATAMLFHGILVFIAGFSLNSVAEFHILQTLIAGSLYTAVVGTIAHLLRG